MAGECHLSAADGPDVQVVHAAHVGHAGEHTAHVVHVDAPGRGLHQHVDRLAQQVPGRVEHQHTDQYRGGGIGPAPAEGPDQAAGGHGAHAAEGVGDHVQPGTAHVQAVVATGLEDPHADEVHQQAAGCDGQHRGTRHGLRVGEALDRLAHDQHRHHDQRDTLGQRCEDLRAHAAVGPALAGGARGDPGREQRQAESGRVGEHVAGIGEQGQGAGQQAADDLGDHI